VSKQTALAPRQTADVVELNVTPLLDYQSEHEVPIQLEIKKFSNNTTGVFKVLPATRDEIIALSVFFGTCHSFEHPVTHEIVPGQTVTASRVSEDIVNLEFVTEADLQDLLQDSEIASKFSVNLSMNATYVYEDLINQILERQIKSEDEIGTLQHQLACVA
jgi:hypothetical protein